MQRNMYLWYYSVCTYSEYSGLQFSTSFVNDFKGKGEVPST